MMGKDGVGFTLDVGIIPTKIGQGSERVKDGMEGIADVVRKCRFLEFAAGKEMIPVGVEWFPAGAKRGEGSRKREAKLTLKEKAPVIGRETISGNAARKTMKG